MILAIMIIPYIAAVMRDVFEQTPVMMKESAYGIGCTTGSHLAHRAAVHQNGVIGGVMLGPAARWGNHGGDLYHR